MAEIKDAVSNPHPSLILPKRPPLSEPAPKGFKTFPSTHDQWISTYRKRIVLPLMLGGVVQTGGLGLPLLLTNCGFNSDNKLSLIKSRQQEDVCKGTSEAIIGSGAAAFLIGVGLLIAPEIEKLLDRKGIAISSTFSPHGAGLLIQGVF